jgi:3-mercaptopyruvate sulfurtransferase SseA
MAASLKDAGWTSVANLRGGIFRWALDGRPLETSGRPTTNVHPFDDRWGRLLTRL